MNLNIYDDGSKFSILVDKSPIPLCHVNGEGKILHFNERFHKTFGYSYDDIPSLDEWWVLAYPDPKYREWVVKTWSDAVRVSIETGKDITPIEYNVTCKNGDIKVMQISGITMDDYCLATFIDVTELNKTREEIDNFFTISLELLCIANTDGYFLKLNPAWEKVVGFSEETLKSKPFVSFIHPEDVEPTQKEVEKLKSGETTINFVNRYRCKDNTYKWLTWTTVPVGNILYAAAMDITSLKLAEETLVKKNQELEQEILIRKEVEKELSEKTVLLESVNQELQQFAYSSSHDLQAPLRKINSFVGLLEESISEHINDDSKHYMDAIKRSADTMSGFIKQLLEYSRSASSEEDSVSIKLKDLIDEVKSSLENDINVSDAEIKTDDLPEYIYGIPVLLHQLFQNIILNSIKYKRKNADPVINIRCKKDNNFLILMFDDNGIGVDDKDRDIIFLPFKRLHSCKEIKGSGIGLATCKKIIQKHKGFIKVENSPEGGARFIIGIPEKVNN